MTSRMLKGGLPCPCGQSSDAYALYDDHGYCFSGHCKSPYFDLNKTEKSSHEVAYRSEAPTEVEMEEYKSPSGFTFEYLSWRGINVETMRFFEATTAVDGDGKPHSLALRYPSGGVKARLFEKKSFPSKGPMSGPMLFGMDRFPAGSAKSITITEGELDAMSAYQMLALPAVSIKGATSAVNDCKANHEYLNSFSRIYLALDDDGPGQEAAAKIVEMFDFNKVYHVKLGKLKDANGYLQEHKEKDFRTIFYNAKNFMPDGIVSDAKSFAEILSLANDNPVVAYPFERLNEVTRGIRDSEFILVTAPEGIGKTEFIRSLEHHFLVNTKDNIATIHMEETVADQLKRMASYDLRVPAHFEGNASNGDILGALGRITGGSDERFNVYTHPDVDDPDAILDAVRFLVTVRKCKRVFLDHISQMVSALSEQDERKTLDYISTKLARMVKNLGFTLFCISHINDDGETRGSRYIGKVANTRIDLSRNKLAADPIERDRMHLVVPKNRFGATTGPAGSLAFDASSFTMSEFVPPAVAVPA